MKEILLTMIEADEGKVLVKDETYCTAVLLRKGETSDGWSEISFSEYERIMEQKK